MSVLVTVFVWSLVSTLRLLIPVSKGGLIPVSKGGLIPVSRWSDTEGQIFIFRWFLQTF